MRSCLCHLLGKSWQNMLLKKENRQKKNKRPGQKFLTPQKMEFKEWVRFSRLYPLIWSQLTSVSYLIFRQKPYSINQRYRWHKSFSALKKTYSCQKWTTCPNRLIFCLKIPQSVRTRPHIMQKIQLAPCKLLPFKIFESAQISLDSDNSDSKPKERSWKLGRTESQRLLGIFWWKIWHWPLY